MLLFSLTNCTAFFSEEKRDILEFLLTHTTIICWWLNASISFNVWRVAGVNHAPSEMDTAINLKESVLKGFCAVATINWSCLKLRLKRLLENWAGLDGCNNQLKCGRRLVLLDVRVRCNWLTLNCPVRCDWLTQNHWVRYSRLTLHLLWFYVVALHLALPQVSWHIVNKQSALSQVVCQSKTWVCAIVLLQRLNIQVCATVLLQRLNIRICTTVLLQRLKNLSLCNSASAKVLLVECALTKGNKEALHLFPLCWMPLALFFYPDRSPRVEWKHCFQLHWYPLGIVMSQSTHHRYTSGTAVSCSLYFVNSFCWSPFDIATSQSTVHLFVCKLICKLVHLLGCLLVAGIKSNDWLELDFQQKSWDLWMHLLYLPKERVPTALRTSKEPTLHSFQSFNNFFNAVSFDLLA